MEIKNIINDIRSKDTITALTALDVLMSMRPAGIMLRPGTITWTDGGISYKVEYAINPKTKKVSAKYFRADHPSSKKTIMNSLSRLKRERARAIECISAIISEADHMRNSYFWQPPGSAASRRWYEEKHSHPYVSWTESGIEFSARFDVGCSCNNIYASGTYTRDGKITTLTAIKKSHERMKRSLALYEEYEDNKEDEKERV